MPVLINQVVKAVDPTADHSTLLIQNIYGWAFLYGGLSILATFATYTRGAVDLDMQIGLKAVIIGAVYRKSLRLSPRARLAFDAGKINSFVNVDVTAITRFSRATTAGCACVAQVAAAMTFIARVLGVTTYLTAGAYFALSILVMRLVPLVLKHQKTYMAQLDAKTKALRELVYGIRPLKMEGADRREGDAIEGIRQAQLKALVKMVVWFGVFFCELTVILQQDAIPTITIIGFDRFGGVITAANVFSVLGLLAALIEPSAVAADAAVGIVQTLPSVRRIAAFLLADEVHPNEITHIAKLDATNKDHPAVKLQSASFSWDATPMVMIKDADGKPSMKLGKFGDVSASPKTNHDNAVLALRNLSLSIPRGSLVAVVGPVGSGKSSLLSALVGGMRHVEGTAVVTGSVGYCAQEAWILSGTLEENIAGFSANNGSSNSSAVQSAVRAVCLDADLKVMPHGLGTRIGERGISCSGGQRARIALARAIVSDPDIYLLDDPLAALDVQVGRAVFEQAICGNNMKGKTVIVATHQLHLLPRFDTVVVMKEGRIAESGPFEQLNRNPDSLLASMMRSYTLDKKGDAAEGDGGTTDVGSRADMTALEKEAKEACKEYENQLAVAEDRREGTVKFHIYLAYFKSAGLLYALVPLILFPISVAALAMSHISLVIWSENKWGWTSDQYFTLYYSIGIVKATVALFQVAALFTLCYKAAVTYHQNALGGLIRAPITWFADQPAGRILNRMTADVQQLDFWFAPLLVNFVVVNLNSLIANLVTLAYGSPYLVIVFVVLGVPSVYAFRFFQTSYRELKRLSSIMQSPLSAHVSETQSGIPSIKAYQWEDCFVARQETTTDLANRALLITQSARFWISLRLSLASAIIMFVSLLLAGSGVVTGGQVGLLLVSAIQIGALINVTLLLWGEVEGSFNVVERLDHYANSLPVEKWDGPDKVPPSWPEAGHIAITNLVIRYPNSTAPVLNNLSLTIPAGSKIAIVGRTGSGKSTLMLALFRLLEASAGTIHIDGHDIANLDLQLLRSRLQIIPQDPILFSGTFRSNMDRYGLYPDDEIWRALDHAGMKDHVAALDKKLDTEVTEGGSNLSSGQRQLIVLAKAILSRSKILVMDEATAAVDRQADERIQRMITTLFRTTTVLCIAHRLNTIADFDRVLVLDGTGALAEYDTPHTLLNTPGSLFRDLVDATGPANAAIINDIARRHYDQNESAHAMVPHVTH
ncbi:P-loop containing nucleoside triphosphate hydrolase protein [Powellomyces hirtus]|nr:P-loop containing nucleoside triphosphate hydrolase protein [Powellomyces hirtus]